MLQPTREIGHNPMATTAELTTPLRRDRDTQKVVGRLMDVVAARFDVVAPQRLMQMLPGNEEFQLRLDNPVVTDKGVASGELTGPYTPSALRHMAERLGVPHGYLQKLMGHEAESVRMLAADNLNRLGEVDDRLALFRYLQTDDGMVLRAVRSDKYFLLDNDAALTAIFKALSAHELGLQDCDVEADVTMDRMRLRIAVPQVSVTAKTLLKGYKSPWDSRDGSELPVIWAGIEITNSETGNGKFQVQPRAVIQICRNGLTRPVEFSRTHLGAALDKGAIEWSDDTVSAALDLITNQVYDAVATFISKKYLTGVVKELRAAKGESIESPTTAVEYVQNRFGFSDDETKSVLDMFMKSGDATVFGLSQAITAAAQTVDDGDRQAEMEATIGVMLDQPTAFIGAV